MKKILSYLLLAFFSFHIFGASSYAFVDSSQLESNKKNSMVYKIKLNETVKWKKYIKIIDAFITKNADNKEILEELSNKLTNILDNSKTTNNSNTDILKYINAKINISLIAIYEEEKNDIYADVISESDKKTIEDKIIKLQLNTLESWYNFTEKFIKEFEDLNNYQETWNFEVDLNIDHEAVGKLDWNIKLSDYTSNVSNFDSQLKWKLETLINAMPKWEKEAKLQLNSMIDLISKDWNMYILLQDLKITDSDTTEKLKSDIEKIKQLAKENKYIKYNNAETQAWLNILKSLNPKAIYEDGKTILAKPLVTAYKKEWNRYYLKPTKYACDKMKELSNRFDPINPSYCSDSQYKNVLKDLSELWTFYAELWNNNETKIVFIWNKLTNNINKNDFSILFDDTKIKEVSYNLEGPNTTNIKLDYKYKSNLNLSIKTIEENNINLVTTINSENKFTKIDLNSESNGSYSRNKMNLKLDNKLISGNFEVVEKSYNWDEDKYMDDSKLSGTISGKTDSDNKLAELYVAYKWNYIADNKEYLNWKFNYINSKFDFQNTYEKYWIKQNIVFNWKFDADKILDSWDFSLKLYKDNNMYKQTFEDTIYTPDYKEYWNISINIVDKNITWTTKITNDWKELLSITHTWNYGKDRFKLKNNFTFINPLGWYVIDAKNSKRSSDIWNIQGAISLKQVEWADIKSFIVQNNKYAWKDIYVWTKKLTIWENYFVWTPNYEVLNIYKQDFLDPNETEYIIWATSENKWQFQIYALMETDEGFKAKVNWTYSPKWNDTKSLIFIDGKQVLDGDLTKWSTVVKEDVNKITWNFDMDFDTSNNKNNIELILNVIIWAKEVFNGKIKNTSNKTIKKVEITTPTNTIDYDKIKY